MKSMINVEKSAPVEMRDGTILPADIYRPADNNKHPAILMRTPYERKRTINSSYLNIIDVGTAGQAETFILTGTIDLAGLLSWSMHMGLANADKMEKGRPDYSRVTVPCFHISGWYDYFTWGTFHSFQQMKNKGGSSAAREGQHILVGPWGHLGPLSDMSAFGDIDFGINGGWGANLSSYNISFFDKYVRGMNQLDSCQVL